jgi:Holliday junction DNA helicase RuvA
MIGKIKGTISEKFKDSYLVETKSGVFYRVYSASSALNEEMIGKNTELYIYTYVREDTLRLFGFKQRRELHFFEILISISGIGPSLGQTMLSFYSPEQIERGVADQDVEFFKEVPGIGKKSAKKVIFELSSKLEKEYELSKGQLSEDESLFIEALENLGFKNKDIYSALKKINQDKPLEEQIRQGIKILSN